MTTALSQNYAKGCVFVYLCFLIIDQMLLQTVSNHPVHIVNNDGDFSPSSFIPFCSFGDEFIGTNIKEFPIPVCDIFKPKHYFDQLCYEINLQELKDSTKIGNQLKMGLTLALDFNKERVTQKFKTKIKKDKKKTKKDKTK